MPLVVVAVAEPYLIATKYIAEKCALSRENCWIDQEHAMTLSEALTTMMEYFYRIYIQSPVLLSRILEEIQCLL